MDPQRGRVKILQKPKPMAEEDVTWSSPAKVATALFGTTTAHGFYRYNPNTPAITASPEAPKGPDALEGQRSGILVGPRSFDGKAAAGIQVEPEQFDKAGVQEIMTRTNPSGVQKRPGHIENGNRPWNLTPMGGLYRVRGRGRGVSDGHVSGHGLQGRGGQERDGEEKVRGRGHWRESGRGRGDSSTVLNLANLQKAPVWSSNGDRGGGSRAQQDPVNEYGVVIRTVTRYDNDVTMRTQFQPHQEGFKKIVDWLDVLDITNTECDPKCPDDNVSSISLRSRSPSPAKAPQKGRPSTTAKRRRVQELLRSPSFEVEMDEAGGVKSMETVHEEMKMKLKINAPPFSPSSQDW